MNEHRRHTCRITVVLLLECAYSGTIGDEAHLAITNTLHHLQREEFHQLRAQEKHEGKNSTTDKQIAICRVALPALDAALQAWNNDDFDQVVDKLQLAAETDGTAPKATRKRRK